jgi:UDP-3-O-[3-hydroxymyristoyl] glucosamine N-acyltransferase
MRVLDIKNYLSEILPNVSLLGDETLKVENIAKIEEAQTGDISFIANPKYEKFLSATNATAIIISNRLKHDAPPKHQAYIKVEDAYAGFVFVLEKFAPKPEGLKLGVHYSAVVQSPVSPSCAIGANAFIGKNCAIGERVLIYPNVVIMDNCAIGDDTTIYPNVTIYQGAKIGSRVVIHSGAVIGADGFGFAPQPDGSYKKIPQIGVVVIEDDVEIGANVCIDRATLGETVIFKGVKLDNLVQVAHNVVIGRNTVIASQAGVSGSTKIGDGCMIGGQAGFAGHLELGDKITVGAQSGVSKSFLKSGQAVRGYPARPLREQLRQEAYLAKIGDLFEQVKKLEAELLALKKQA